MDNERHVESAGGLLVVDSTRGLKMLAETW